MNSVSREKISWRLSATALHMRRNVLDMTLAACLASSFGENASEGFVTY